MGGVLRQEGDEGRQVGEVLCIFKICGEIDWMNSQNPMIQQYIIIISLFVLSYLTNEKTATYEMSEFTFKSMHIKAIKKCGAEGGACLIIQRV